MRKCILFTIIIFISAILLSINRFNSRNLYASETNDKTMEFSDPHTEPVLTIYTEEKAELIKQNLEAIFVPSTILERKRSEKNLVELVSAYELPEKDSVEVDCTWSSPLNYDSSGSRKAVVAFIHAGTGHYISFWILCEFEENIKSFFLQGSSKGCGIWQVCKELNGDNNPEIIIKNYIGDYDGSMTVAVWPAIYRWNTNNYIRADDEFPNYYAQEVVPQYRKILEEHKDWENHTDKKIRQIYQKCKFTLEKAESIINYSESEM